MTKEEIQKFKEAVEKICNDFNIPLDEVLEEVTK